MIACTLNATRLAERGIDEAPHAIGLLVCTLNNQAVVNEINREVLAL